MIRKVLSVLAVSTFVLAFSLPLTTRAVPPKPAKAPVATALHAPQEKGNAKEAHPEINEAIKQLQATRQGLQKFGAHDFGGHRVKAIDHIDQAIAELREALKYDKH